MIVKQFTRLKDLCTKTAPGFPIKTRGPQKKIRNGLLLCKGHKPTAWQHGNFWQIIYRYVIIELKGPVGISI